MVLAAICLSACGGSDDSTATDTSSVPTESTQSTGDSSTAKQQQGPGEHAERPQSEAEERATYERERYGLPSHRSAGFRASSRKGVLKHVPEFGDESSAAERNQAQQVLAAYLGAVREDEWSKACKYLLPEYVASLEASSRAATGAPRDCGEALSSISEEAAKQPGPRFPAAEVPEVTSFRIEAYPSDRAEELGVEEAGFALMHAGNGDYWATLTREGGEWKVTSPSPHLLG